MRGREGERDPIERYGGITPARAGKSRMRMRISLMSWNYPRSCGEERSRWVMLSLRWELPPLVRGRVGPFRPEIYGLGITPARAGKRHPPN